MNSDTARRLRQICFFLYITLLTGLLVPVQAAPRYGRGGDGGGQWVTFLESAGECHIFLTHNGQTSETNTSWVSGIAPAYFVTLAQNDTCDVAQHTTWTVTMRWLDAWGNPASDPPPAPAFIAFANANWQAGAISLPAPGAAAFGAPSNIFGIADDGMNDAQQFLAWNGSGTSGTSQGVHAVTGLDDVGGTVTWTCTQLSVVHVVNDTIPSFRVTGATDLSICSGPTPFPVEIVQTDPVVFLHGTTKAWADQITTLPDPNIPGSGFALDAVGTADFGRGFYTIYNTADGKGLKLAKNLAYRAVSKSADPTQQWAVIEFDVDLINMLEFLCIYQNKIVGFTSDAADARPPWNALTFPGDQPDDNAPDLIPAGQMNWLNFCWYNWYKSHCDGYFPISDDAGTADYIPYWTSDLASTPDWQQAMIWGHFYYPKKQCPMPRGARWDNQYGAYGVYQYLWGSDGGLDFLNITVGPGYGDNYLVPRSIKTVGTGAPPLN